MIKFFYFSLVGFVLLIWFGAFDPQPLGNLSQQQSIPAETSFTVRTTGNRLSLKTELSTLTIAIDPTGYVAIWRTHNAKREWLQRWQTWPHVREDANEIWVDWEADKISLRINRELFWHNVFFSFNCPCTIEQDIELFLP